MFMIGDGVLTVSIQMSGWFLCMQAKLVASATSNLCEAYGVMNSIVATKDVASPLLLTCQVKADGTTGDYRYILTTQSYIVHIM